MLVRIYFGALCFLFVLILISYLGSDDLSPEKSRLIGFCLVVLVAALVVPYVLNYCPDKEYVDLAYYSAAALVAVGVYISQDYEREVVSLQRQIGSAERDIASLAVSISEFEAMQRSRQVVIQAMYDAVQSYRGFVALELDKNCAPRTKDTMDYFKEFSGSGAESIYQDMHEEQLRAERCSENRVEKHRIDELVKNYLEGRITAVKMVESIPDKVHMLSARLSEKGKYYQLEYLYEIYFWDGSAFEEKIKEVTGAVKGIEFFIGETQKRMRESISRSENQVTIDISTFLRVAWPYFAVFLFGLKIARVPYLRKFRDAIFKGKLA